MYSFFVLGLIPGTNLQITWQVWIDGVLLCAGAISMLWLYRRHEAELVPYFHTSTVQPLIREFSNNAYQRGRRQFKAFLINQLASWQAL